MAKGVQSFKISSNALGMIIALVAAMMLLLILIPSSIWHHPINDAEYYGFDPNLIYMNDNGGLIKASTELLEISALPQSRPTVHLFTTPFEKVKVSFDVRILNNQFLTCPLRIDFWSARNGSGNFIEFSSSPDNILRSGILIDGISTLVLTDGIEIKNETLGTYDVGRRYHFEINMDKEKGSITTITFAKDAPPTNSSMLRVEGSESSTNSDVISEHLPVEGGKEYKFGGMIKSVYGTSIFKLNIQWLDKELNHIGFFGDWQSILESDGWKSAEFKATAPEDAYYCRILVGAGEGDQLFFANLFFNEENDTKNLIKNGDFNKGTEGWTRVDKNGLPEILDPYPLILNSTVTKNEVPQLFNSLRLSLTLSTEAKSGFSKVLIDNYSLILPHQKWQTTKVNDFYLTIIISAIITIGGLLLLKTGVLYGLKIIIKKSELLFIRTVNFAASNISLFKKIILFLIIYFLLNAFLFSLGNLPFDILSEKIWTYITVQYSPMELYYLPNLVPLAEVWGGTPLHEAVFPYNFGFSYLFSFLGVLYKFFFNGPGDLVINSFALEAIIKSVNVLFVLLDGVLICLILRRKKLERRQNIIASILFFLNPAVIFASSIWGQTHAISIFFMLAAFWAFDNQHSIWTWIFLGLSVINRPQMLIPSLLFSVIVFRKFSLKENLHALSVSFVIIFLLLAPFSLVVSPTLPVDVLTNTLAIQEGGVNEVALTTVSLDTYNLWPLITYLQGARGLDRILFPSATILLGHVSYAQISQILVVSLILIGAVMLIRLNRKSFDLGIHYPILAFVTVGFFILKTGLAATHFILALPLIILCRNFMGKKQWYCTIIILTMTILIPMYGTLGFGIEQVEYLAPALHGSNNVVTKLFMSMFATDFIISLGSLANLGLFGGLVIISMLQIIKMRERQVDEKIPR